MKVMTPKKYILETVQCFGECFGMSVKVSLVSGQKWEAHKKGGYWWLSRKGVPFELRLTEAALAKMFKEV